MDKRKNTTALKDQSLTGEVGLSHYVADVLRFGNDRDDVISALQTVILRLKAAPRVPNRSNRAAV